jgi:hypothetical protein
VFVGLPARTPANGSMAVIAASQLQVEE